MKVQLSLRKVNKFTFISGKERQKIVEEVLSDKPKKIPAEPTTPSDPRRTKSSSFNTSFKSDSSFEENTFDVAQQNASFGGQTPMPTFNDTGFLNNISDPRNSAFEISYSGMTPGMTPSMTPNVRGNFQNQFGLTPSPHGPSPHGSMSNFGFQNTPNISTPMSQSSFGSISTPSSFGGQMNNGPKPLLDPTIPPPKPFIDPSVPPPNSVIEKPPPLIPQNNEPPRSTYDNNYRNNRGHRDRNSFDRSDSRNFDRGDNNSRNFNRSDDRNFNRGDSRGYGRNDDRNVNRNDDRNFRRNDRSYNNRNDDRNYGRSRYDRDRNDRNRDWRRDSRDDRNSHRDRDRYGNRDRDRYAYDRDRDRDKGRGELERDSRERFNSQSEENLPSLQQDHMIMQPPPPAILPPTMIPPPIIQQTPQQVPPKPRTPEPEPSEDEPRVMSLDSRIQSLLQSSGMVDTFGSPSSDSTSDSRKKELSPPHSASASSVDNSISASQTPFNNFHSTPSDNFSASMDRKQGHELDFRENHKNHPQFVQNPYMQTPIDTPYMQTPGDSFQHGVTSQGEAEDDKMSISSGESGNQNIEINPNILSSNNPQSSANFMTNPNFGAEFPQYGNYMGYPNPPTGDLYNQNYFNQYNNVINNQQSVQNQVDDEKLDKTFSSVLDKFVKELKEIMQKDMCKKMVESSAFKSFDSWWTTNETRTKVTHFETI